MPASSFENLNSLETLNIQNNKLSRIPEEVMEPIIDTLRVVDIVGEKIILFMIYENKNKENNSFHISYINQCIQIIR